MLVSSIGASQFYTPGVTKTSNPITLAPYPSPEVSLLDSEDDGIPHLLAFTSVNFTFCFFQLLSHVYQVIHNGGERETRESQLGHTTDLAERHLNLKHTCDTYVEPPSAQLVSCLCIPLALDTWNALTLPYILYHSVSVLTNRLPLLHSHGDLAPRAVSMIAQYTLDTSLNPH
jgi:hypothetical protein